jgi:hypothetical protein
MLDTVAVTDIVRHAPCALQVIAHRHAITTLGADHQSLQQRRAFTRRAPITPCGRPLGIVTQDLEVLLILVPGDIPGVGITNQRDPFFRGQPLMLARTVGPFAYARASKAKGAGITRMMQEP